MAGLYDRYIRSGSGGEGGKIHGVFGFYNHFGGYNAYIWETYLDHLPQNHMRMGLLEPHDQFQQLTPLTLFLYFICAVSSQRPNCGVVAGPKLVV